MALKDNPLWPSIPVTDLARAKHFYEDILALEPLPAGDGHALYRCGTGTGLLIYQRGPAPSEHTLAGWRVTNLDETMAELRAKGVVFEEYDLPNLKTVAGIASYGEGNRSAWFKDPDGNTFSLNEMGS